MTAVALHYTVDGAAEARALLLANPIGTELSVWEPLVPVLSRRFRVIRCDLRGHGRSPVPNGPYTIDELGRDVLALLDRLGVERASICGSSLGGMVALWLAVHAPGRIERLALLCTSAQLGTAEGWHQRAALVRAQGPAATARAAVERWFTAGFAARMPSLIAELEAMVARTPAEGYAGCCEAIASWDIRAQLPAITAPTLVIAGKDDPATPPAHAYAIGAGIPGCNVHVLDAAAHLALRERPLLVSRLLLEHLDAHAEHPAAEATRRGVLGDAHVDRAQARASDFTAPFQELITQYAWGSVWPRPGLTRAERSLVTLSALVALHHDEELAMHVLAALRNGLTVEQIREALLHTAIYAGVPAANRAFAIAQRALLAAGELEPPPE